jgi:hypothetical protein
MSNTSSTVIARLSITRFPEQSNMIIEVHSDSTWEKFYYFYTQTGRKTSTKTLVRTASRNEGLSYASAYRMMPGLEILACRWASMPNVKKVQVRILRKRAYKHLITAQPSELGQAIIRVLFPTPYYTTHQS